MTLKLSTAALGTDDSSSMPIGTGAEPSSHAKLQAVPWTVQVDDGKSGELFGAIRRLADPSNTRVKLARGFRPGYPLVEVEWQPALPWRLPRGKPPVELRLDVWLAPQLFDLRISGWHSPSSCFYDIWVLFDSLVPMAPIVKCPRPPPVHGDAQLAPCGAATAPSQLGRPAPHSFTLAGLMRALESAGYEEMADPPGLQLTLFPFQRQSLQWMVDRETQPGGLNALFWQVSNWTLTLALNLGPWASLTKTELINHKTPCARSTRVRAVPSFTTTRWRARPGESGRQSSLAASCAKRWGSARPSRCALRWGSHICSAWLPPHKPRPRDNSQWYPCSYPNLDPLFLALLAGRCALILANPFTSGASVAGRKMLSNGSLVKQKTRATLIVVPVVLLQQWETEIQKCAGGRLTVVVHHGGDAMKKQGYKDTTMARLQQADVVLTTYEVLRAEAPWLERERCLLRMHWWRVVLDESQRVPKPLGAASAMTAIAKACEELSRTHSWCMSGTPVGNMVDGTESLVSILRRWRVLPTSLSLFPPWLFRAARPDASRDRFPFP